MFETPPEQPARDEESLMDDILGDKDVWWIPNIFEDSIETAWGAFETTKGVYDKGKEMTEKAGDMWEKGKEMLGWDSDAEREAKETYADAAGDKANLLGEVIEGIMMRYLPEGMKWWDIARPLLNPVLGERQEMFSWENEFRWMTATGGEVTPEWALNFGQAPLIKAIEQVAPDVAKQMEDDPEMPLEKVRELLQWYVVFEAAKGQSYTN